MKNERTCDVCQAEPVVGVAASSLGPISLAYGRTCLDENAEPLWVLAAAYGFGDPDELRRLIVAGNVPAPTNVRVYADGKYQDLEDWAATA